jgi:nicotinamide-nucleotide amidase
VQNLNAEIITIGTEILLGEITDTNSVYIARALRDIGINLYFMTSVGDNEQRIADAIHIALARAQIVITCGGLGPTIDDMTRQAVAIATQRGLTFHQNLLDQIAARFAGFRMIMTDNNRRQAFLPDNAIVIENPVGTAPSFIVEHEGSLVISLPGVPREMKFLMMEKVIPYLQSHYHLGIIKAHVLRTAGIGESTLDDAIGKELLEASNPTVGLAAHSGQVDIRVTAKAATLEEAERMIHQVETKLRERVGAYIFGTDEDTLEQALVTLLHEHQATIAISETGLGSAVSARIEAVNQGRDILAATLLYDHPDNLRQDLATANDISLQDLALQAAETICRNTIAIAGIAIVSRPDVSESADSEQGTAVAIYSAEKSRSRVYGFGGQADMARLWVSTWAMAMTWQMLRQKLDANQF